MNNQLYIGAGKSPIYLPKEIFPINKYTEVHDELNVRVTIIQTKISIAIVSLELTSIPKEIIRELKMIVHKTVNINTENIWICATHTFSAPHFIHEASSHKTDEDIKKNRILLNMISTALSKALLDAVSALTLATVGMTKGRCSININRNIKTERGWWLGTNEKGISKKDVSILRFNRKDNGRPIAILFNYDIQPSIMEGSFTTKGDKLITGDLVGEASRYIENVYPDIVATFLLGSAGDQAPIFKACNQKITNNGQIEIPDIHEEGFTLVKQLGQYLGKRVVDYSEEILNYHHDLKLSLWKRTVRCPEQVMLRPTKEIRPEKHYTFNLTGRYIETSIEVIKLGNILIIGTQPELNSGYGALIKSLSLDYHIIVTTMVNGSMKYLPEEKDYNQITYVAMNTFFGEGSNEIYLKEMKSLLDEINKR